MTLFSRLSKTAKLLLVLETIVCPAWFLGVLLLGLFFVCNFSTSIN
jgi:hypothetical protein